jgi:hypothetical protein
MPARSRCCPERTRHLDFGAVAAVWGLPADLGVAAAVDQETARPPGLPLSPGTYLALAVLNRVVDPCSKRGFADWWRTTEVPRPSCRPVGSREAKGAARLLAGTPTVRDPVLLRTYRSGVQQAREQREHGHWVEDGVNGPMPGVGRCSACCHWASSSASVGWNSMAASAGRTGRRVAQIRVRRVLPMTTARRCCAAAWRGTSQP